MCRKRLLAGPFAGRDTARCSALTCGACGLSACLLRGRHLFLYTVQVCRATAFRAGQVIVRMVISLMCAALD